MRKPRKHWVFPLLLVQAAIAGLVLAWFGLREPAYAGKNLSQWVEAYYLMTERTDMVTLNPDPAEAIEHIGTRAIPHLLKWIQYETPPWKRRASDALNLILRGFKPSLARTDEEELRDLRADAAKEAFSVLGRKATGAIGELGRLARDPKVSRATAERAIAALGYVGEDALPALVAVLTSQQQGSVRASAARRIGEMGTNALPAVPILLQCGTDEEESVAVIASDILSELGLDPAVTVPVWVKCLQDGRYNVRRSAIFYLGNVGIRAEAAAPSLLRLLGDEDPFIRASATNALRRIGHPVESLNGQ